MSFDVKSIHVLPRGHMLPSGLDLTKMRKGLRRRALPKVFKDTSGAWEEVGQFAFGVSPDGRLQAVWNWEGETVRTADFVELSTSESMIDERLSLGWLIAEIIQLDANRIRGAIPGPNEAMRATAAHDKMVSSWRHWALVPPGFMNGLDTIF